MEENLFGVRKALSYSEYNKIYTDTGLDIDGRRETFQSLVPILEPGVENYVEWSKKIPGFKMMSLNDQLKVIKCKSFEKK